MAPATLVSDLFNLLQKAGYTVLADVKGCELYAPARSLDEIRVLDIIRVVNMDGEHRVFEEFDQKFGFLDRLLGTLADDTRQSEANLTLLDCAEQYSSSILGIAPEDEHMGTCSHTSF